MREVKKSLKRLELPPEGALVVFVLGRGLCSIGVVE
jgi:hypothetical protein